MSGWFLDFTLNPPRATTGQSVKPVSWAKCLLLYADAFAIALALASTCVDLVQRVRDTRTFLRYPSAFITYLLFLHCAIVGQRLRGTLESCARTLLTWAAQCLRTRLSSFLATQVSNFQVLNHVFRVAQTSMPLCDGSAVGRLCCLLTDQPTVENWTYRYLSHL
jgi:hypothetical protein